MEMLYRMARRQARREAKMLANMNKDKNILSSAPKPMVDKIPQKSAAEEEEEEAQMKARWEADQCPETIMRNGLGHAVHMYNFNSKHGLLRSIPMTPPLCSYSDSDEFDESDEEDEERLSNPSLLATESVADNLAKSLKSDSYVLRGYKDSARAQEMGSCKGAEEVTSHDQNEGGTSNND